LKDKIKNYENFDKNAKEKIKNQKKNDQIKINIITIENIHKFDLKDKIINYKTFDKRVKGKNIKSKVERPNRKTSYIQIIIKVLNRNKMK
jgi:hypothetical protein